MNRPSTVARQPRFAVSFATLESGFSLVYTALMVNVCLVLANLPLVLFFIAVPDRFAYVPMLLLLSLTLAPSITAAFGCFRRMREESGTRPFVIFWRSYRTTFARSSVVGVATAALIAFLLIDCQLLAAISLAFVSSLAMLGLVAVAVAVMSLAGFAWSDVARPRAIIRAAFYLAIKRWYFSLLTLVFAGLAVLIITVQPILGMFLAPSPLLFVIWSNAHYSFTKLVESANDGVPAAEGR